VILITKIPLENISDKPPGIGAVFYFVNDDNKAHRDFTLTTGTLEGLMNIMNTRYNGTAGFVEGTPTRKGPVVISQAGVSSCYDAQHLLYFYNHCGSVPQDPSVVPIMCKLDQLPFDAWPIDHSTFSDAQLYKPGVHPQCIEEIIHKYDRREPMPLQLSQRL